MGCLVGCLAVSLPGWGWLAGLAGRLFRARPRGGPVEAQKRSRNDPFAICWLARSSMMLMMTVLMVVRLIMLRVMLVMMMVMTTTLMVEFTMVLVGVW